jgi:Mg-chelatase subunit ChlD
MRAIVLSLFLMMMSAMTSHAQGTIVLVVDTSSSMNQQQMELQIKGYATVLGSVASVRTRDVVAITFDASPVLISNGTYLEAQTAFSQYTILPAEHRGHTCLSAALMMVEQMVPTLKQPIVVDISGDGRANCAEKEMIPGILNRLENQYNVQVNTLYINNEHHEHINGPDQMKGRTFFKSLIRNGGFMMATESFMDFELSLFEKLTLEISWLDQ